jgi:uncharacterized protein YbjT (DUF2867 family)
MKILLTGATGYVGQQLLPVLLASGHDVRCLARTPEALQGQCEDVVQGDVLTAAGLDEALAGIDVAYYLIHSMVGGGDYAERDRRAATNFAKAAREAGVRRVIYLGGLGPDDGEGSGHLTSRHETAEILKDSAPEFVYARAAVVIGDGSLSLIMLRHLVERLPAMICPRWIDVNTQPIAATDLVAALTHCAEVPDLSGEVQLGGADVVTYRQMMLSLAKALGRRKPIVIRVPVLTPKLSSHWVGFVTAIDSGVAKPLIDGLKAETIVTMPPSAGINDAPMGLDAAMRAAVEPQ